MIKSIKITAALLIPAVLILVLSFCSTAPRTTEMKPEPEAEAETAGEMKRLEEIEKLIQAGATGKAVELYEKHFSANSGTAEDLLVYGMLLFNAGRIDDAGEALDKADRLEPGNREILYNLALVEGARGDSEAQREVLKRIINDYPDDADVHTSLGNLYLAENKRKEAEESFLAALEADEDHVEARMGLGDVFFEREKYEEALEEYDRVIAGSPDYASAYSQRGRARMADKDFGGALSDLARAIELDPDYFWNYLDRGRMLLRQGETDKALEDFSRAIELNNSIFFPFAYRGAIYERRGMVEKAVSDYERTVELKPDYYFAHSALGALYFGKHEWAKAAGAFKTAAPFVKEDYALPLLAGVAMIRGGDADKAADYLTESMKKVSRDSIFYHLYRLFIEPGYENSIIYRIEQLEDEEIKYRALFYVGQHYIIEGRYHPAELYLLEAKDRLPEEAVEAGLAAGELERMDFDD